MTCAQVNELLGAYALRALEPDDERPVATHLRQCAGCLAELQRLEQVKASLGLAAPRRSPSAALKANLLQKALEVQSPERSDGRQLSWRQAGSLAAVLAAAVAIVWGASLQGQLAAQQADLARLRDRSERYDRVVAVLTSGQAVVKPLLGTEYASEAGGRVIFDRQTGAGMLMAWGLPRLPEAEAFQIWLVRGQERLSLGLARQRDGPGFYTFIQLPPDSASYQAVGITQEPAGGSKGPTGPRVLFGEL